MHKGVSEGEEGERGAKRTFKEWPETFQILMKE